MNSYECVYIIDAHAPAHTRDEAIKNVEDAATKAQVKITASQIWLDKHKMSFPINKLWEGTYYMLNCEASSDAINKWQGLLRINEHLLRFLVLRLEDKKV